MDEETEAWGGELNDSKSHQGQGRGFGLVPGPVLSFFPELSIANCGNHFPGSLKVQPDV
jgi:hypothetical protein